MIDSKSSLEGVIIKGIGGFYYVSSQSGITECRARGKLRADNLSPMVGDRVTVSVGQDGTGSITKIMPRRNFLIRPDAANIDAVVLVSAAHSPMPDYFLTDKLLAVAESKDIETIICLNKTDIAERGDISEFVSVYERAGYRVIMTCAAAGKGIDEIKSAILNKTVCFAGLSGVGKSSLIKCITGLDIKCGSVSRIERGRHTTRHVELIPYDGGFVLDTPGFSRFSASELTAQELWQYFPEIRALHGTCRFRTCNHRGEPGCKVKEAQLRGEIAESRLNNYIQMFNESDNIKLWQRKD